MFISLCRRIRGKSSKLPQSKSYCGRPRSAWTTTRRVLHVFAGGWWVAKIDCNRIYSYSCPAIEFVFVSTRMHIRRCLYDMMWRLVWRFWFPNAFTCIHTYIHASEHTNIHVYLSWYKFLDMCFCMNFLLFVAADLHFEYFVFSEHNEEFACTHNHIWAYIDVRVYVYVCTHAHALTRVYVWTSRKILGFHNKATKD